MIGTNLNLTLPSLADNMATTVANITNALSAIQTSIADKATPAALNINTALSLGGNWATNVGSLVLVPGNLSSAAGSMYYTGGEFWVVDASGAIQLTTGGAINVSTAHGFTGDYGGVGVTAQAYFDNASGEYRFYRSTGVLGDLVSRDVVLTGAAGTVRLHVDAAITTARTVGIKALPTSGISGLVYNAATSTVEDSAVTRETNNHLFTQIDLSGNLAHDSQQWHQRSSMSPAVRLTNCGINSGDSLSMDSTAPNWTWRGGSLPLRTGDRILSFDFQLSVYVSGTITLALYRGGFGGGGLVESHSFAPGATGTYAYTLTTPAALAAGEFYFFELLGASSGVRVASVGYGYDRQIGAAN